MNKIKVKKKPWWYIFFVFTFNTNAATVEEPGFSKHVEKKQGGNQRNSHNTTTTVCFWNGYSC